MHHTIRSIWLSFYNGTIDEIDYRIDLYCVCCYGDISKYTIIIVVFVYLVIWDKLRRGTEASITWCFLFLFSFSLPSLSLSLSLSRHVYTHTHTHTLYPITAMVMCLSQMSESWLNGQYSLSQFYSFWVSVHQVSYLQLRTCYLGSYHTP